MKERRAPLTETVTEERVTEERVAEERVADASGDGGNQPPRSPEELVLAHLGLARQLASHFTHRGEAYDDLVQVASLALIEAASRFDEERGVQFSTFAITCIAGELKRHFRDRAWAVRAPRRLQELYLELGTTVDRLSQELGRTPTVSELAGVLEVTESDVLEALEAGRAYRTSSLDEPDQDGHAMVEQLGENEAEFDHIEDRSVLGKALSQLSPRDQLVLKMRFVDGLTQSEIGAQLGLSQMQISRLLAAGVERLRSTITDGKVEADDLS